MPTYYVATAGNDGASGLSPADAWQTIPHINAQAFVAGDEILFNRGDTWAAVTLLITWSGAAGSPIRLADYGTGARPIIDGNNAVECIVATGRSYLAFENLETTQGFNAGFLFTTCDNVGIVECDSHDAGNDQLIFIAGCFSCSVTGGRFYNGYQRVIGTIISGIEIADDCYDITLSGVRCYDNTGTIACGITIHSHVATGMPYDIVVENAECYGNDAHGLQIYKQDNTLDGDRNIQVRDCILRENTLDGLRIYKSAGAANYPNGINLRRLSLFDNGRYGYWLEGDDIDMRRCMINNQRNFMNACTGLIFYHNTHYSTVAAGLLVIFIQNARTDGITFRNNIIMCTEAGGQPIGVNVGATTNVDIDFTLYSHPNPALNRWFWAGASFSYANWLINSGMDANSPAPTDPLFLDAPNDNFFLDHGSPALQAGTPIAGMPFYGAAPDCGRWEMRWKSQRSEQELKAAWRYD